MVSNRRCVVEDCPNSSSRTRLKDKDIKYYSFPKDEEMREAWRAATLPLDLPEKYNPDHNSFICSEHFGVNDFQRDLKAELLNLKPKRLLKPEAVPSKNIRRSDADGSLDINASNSDSESQNESCQTTFAETASNSFSELLKDVPGLNNRIELIQPSNFVVELREKLYKRKQKIAQSSQTNEPNTEEKNETLAVLKTKPAGVLQQDTRKSVNNNSSSVPRTKPAGVLQKDTRNSANANSSIPTTRRLIKVLPKELCKSSTNNLPSQNRRDPIKGLWRGSLSETQSRLVADLANSIDESPQKNRPVECQRSSAENVSRPAGETQQEAPTPKNRPSSVNYTKSFIVKWQNDIRKSLIRNRALMNSSKSASQSKSAEGNKENVLFSDPAKQQNGFIISYLGVPKVMIYPGFYEDYDGNESQKSDRTIIPLEENFQLNLFTLVPNKTIFDLPELCRLCGSYSNRMKSIFDDKECDFVHLIRYHLPGIKINKDDDLPTVICSRCELKLVSWNQFHKTCQSVNRRYAAIMKKMKIDKSCDAFLNTLDGAHANRVLDQRAPIDDSSIEVMELEPDKSGYGINAENDPASELGTETFDDSEAEKSATEDDSSVEWIENVVAVAEPSMSSAAKKDRIRKRKKASSVRRMCHLCGNVFSFAESLHRHLLTVHSDEKPFKCSTCQRRFNRRHNLTIHVRAVHERTRRVVKKIECLCDHCGKVLRSPQSLREHVSAMHTKVPLYKCDKCHVSFYRKMTFVKHKASPDCSYGVPSWRESPRREPKDENFLKHCEICGLEFSKRYFYEQHALKHATKFTCSKCESEFTNYGELRGHEDAAHPELNPFVCEICGKRFKRQSLLYSHSLTHRNERKFECDECAARFSKKKYLVSHMMRHTGERPFTCSICNKGFRQSGDMRKHKAKHLTEGKRGSDIVWSSGKEGDIWS